MADNPVLPEKADYTQVLQRTEEWHTAKVPPWDMNRLTHQLRYQAERLHLGITIHTNKEAKTVSFRTVPADDEREREHRRVYRESPT
jgi:hypothetical protein